MKLERTVDNERTRVVRAEEIESEATSISELVANMELRVLECTAITRIQKIREPQFTSLLKTKVRKRV